MHLILKEYSNLVKIKSPSWSTHRHSWYFPEEMSAYWVFENYCDWRNISTVFPVGFHSFKKHLDNELTTGYLVIARKFCECFLHMFLYNPNRNSGAYLSMLSFIKKILSALTIRQVLFLYFLQFCSLISIVFWVILCMPGK